MKEMLERIGVLHEASSKGARDKSLHEGISVWVRRDALT
jgi:hypothetical protein